MKVVNPPLSGQGSCNVCATTNIHARKRGLAGMGGEAGEKMHQQAGSYTVKKVRRFPVPSRDATNQTLTGRELFKYSRPSRVWLEASRLGKGKRLTFFYSVVLKGHSFQNGNILKYL